MVKRDPLWFRHWRRLYVCPSQSNILETTGASNMTIAIVIDLFYEMI